jgi:hypothetical protein
MPMDMRVMVENPPGYGFGDAALRALGGTRFQPNPADPNWHYANITLRNAPVPPPAYGSSPNTLSPQPGLPPPDYAPAPGSAGNPFKT